MSKHYLEIPFHSFYGDFYYIDEPTHSASFRADNLDIATRIGFNCWLRNFNNLHHECSLVSITPGKFTVSTDKGTETHTVAYYGPRDMFEIGYVLDHVDNPELIAMLDAIQLAYENGNNSVRISKRSGRLMFSESVTFPRWKPGYHDMPCDEQINRIDEYWFPWEHRYLNTNDLSIARLQMQYAKISYEVTP